MHSKFLNLKAFRTNVFFKAWAVVKHGFWVNVLKQWGWLMRFDTALTNHRSIKVNSWLGWSGQLILETEAHASNSYVLEADKARGMQRASGGNGGQKQQRKLRLSPSVPSWPLLVANLPPIGIHPFKLTQCSSNDHPQVSRKTKGVDFS